MKGKLKAIGIHSFKGGAGKTFVALNLSYMLSIKKRVCLIDFDLRAPCLYAFFKGEKYLNHLLLSNDTCDSYLVKVTDKLSVMLASPSLDEIRKDSRRSEREEIRILEKLLEIKKELKRKFDYIILDTTPGLYYRSVNSMLASDILLFIVRPEKIDADGLKKLEDVTSNIKAPKYVILNRAQNDFEPETSLQIIARIPCACDITMDTPFFTKDNSKNPITESFQRISDFILMI